ncbi:cell wall integrity protein scw1 [Melampsora larici-populina 98AG31]|uniref:Cell wall integrity protein scw1 n=1 Tax=Melampsora larici-populina (strain 98AG31 / pathotype 3-4-7) TaxID=747676 RepID=F4RXN6_MELLP|nr:cell wall integrity protein scw1 [Melampsora larici-populina 98AG31]EGG02865.1 cell wall integrity protein scw1 [Melampsora larici-populina 98AG31]
MSILLSSDHLDKNTSSAPNTIDHTTNNPNQSIFSSNLTPRRSNISNLTTSSSPMKNENTLGSQSIPEVEESAGSLLDSSPTSTTTRNQSQSNSTSLRDFQSDPLLGPRRSSTYSNRDDSKSSSLFSPLNSAFSSFSFNPIKTTSSNLSANQIFYSSATNTPSPTTQQADSPRLSSTTLASTKSLNTSIEPFDLDQHNSSSTLHPGARSYSSPGTSTSLSTNQQSSRDGNRSLGSNLQASQSDRPLRQEESSAPHSSSSWPLTANSTGPLDYCPGRDAVSDRHGWLYVRPGQSGSKNDPIPPTGIPRSLSLQEMPTIPWLGQDRTTQSFGPPPSGAIPGGQESLYTEPALGRRMSLKSDMTSPPSNLKNLGSYYNPNTLSSNVYNDQTRDPRVTSFLSNDPSSFQQRLHAFIPPNATMRPISPTNRSGRIEQVAEEISTIFVVGFPEDMDEREFQNMFMFSPGFEAATLKVPATALAARDHAMSPTGPHGSSISLPSTSHGTVGQSFSSTAPNMMDPFGMPLGYDGLEDLYSPLGIGCGPNASLQGLVDFSGLAGAGISPFGNRRQIIGFAKFKTRADALHARDVLSGRRVDAEKGCILKAELAKKNLHTKRGLSNEASAPLTVSTPAFSFNGGYFNPFSPSGDPFSPNNKSNNVNSDSGTQSGPHRVKNIHRSSIDSDHQLQMNHFFEVEHRTLSNSIEPCQFDMSATRPRSSSTFDPFLITATNSLNLLNEPTRGKSLIESFGSPTSQRAPIDYSAFAATPNPHHFTNSSGYGGRLTRTGSLGCGTNPINTGSTWFINPGPATTTVNMPAEKVGDKGITTDRPGSFAPTFFPLVPNSSSGGSSGSSDSSSTGSRPSLGSSPTGLGSTLPPNSAPNSLSTSSALMPPNSTGNVCQNSLNRTHYPADQNPAINTLYVGNLPTVIPGTAVGDNVMGLATRLPAPFPHSNGMMLVGHPHHPNTPIMSIPNPSTSVSGMELEDRLRKLFGKAEGFKRFSFRSKAGQPMCFVEFVNVEAAKKAMENLYGDRLDGLVPGGIRLAFSRNALGVRSNQPNHPNFNQFSQSTNRNLNPSTGLSTSLPPQSSTPHHNSMIIPFTNHNLNLNPTHQLVASSSTSLNISSS